MGVVSVLTNDHDPLPRDCERRQAFFSSPPGIAPDPASVPTVLLVLLVDQTEPRYGYRVRLKRRRPSRYPCRARSGSSSKSKNLDVININLLALAILILTLTPILIELKLQSPSPSWPYVSVSLIFALSGSSPYAFRERASSALYLRITSPFSSW